MGDCCGIHRNVTIELIMQSETLREKDKRSLQIDVFYTGMPAHEDSSRPNTTEERAMKKTMERYVGCTGLAMCCCAYRQNLVGCAYEEINL
jgi:hypothetical protein